MRITAMGAAVALYLVLVLVNQAMAQRDPAAGGTAGSAPASGVSKPDITKPEATNPATTENTNPNANPTITTPGATNPGANNSSFNFNNQNPATTNENPNNPNLNNQNPTANVGGRTESGTENRTDRSGERGNRDDIQWRYRFYNGVWWYWLPENRWVYWSNNSWQDFNPGAVNYQYEYDQNGRPIRYRTGYRGYAEQNEQNRAGNEIRTGTGRREASTDSTHRDNEANRTGANRSDPNRSDADRSDKNRSDRDRESSKSNDNRSEENLKSNSTDHSESKSGK